VDFEWNLTTASIISLLTFLLGHFFGNRLAIGRDKRKERNIASKPLYDGLHGFLFYKRNSSPNSQELSIFTSYVPWYSGWIYEIRVKQFEYERLKDQRSQTYDPLKGITTIESGHISRTKNVGKKLLWHLKSR
jgi:hypothetical protein